MEQRRWAWMSGSSVGDLAEGPGEGKEEPWTGGLPLSEGPWWRAQQRRWTPVWEGARCATAAPYLLRESCLPARIPH